MISGWLMTREASNGVTNTKTVTGGGEPPFSWDVFMQNSAGTQETHHDLWYTDEHRGTPWMVTSSQVTPTDHVRMQAAACAFCCMSVSKTINMDETATVEDVREAYELAWRLSIPGTSIYRNNSKPMQVLSALECPSGECAVDYSAMPSDDQAEVQLGGK